MNKNIFSFLQGFFICLLTISTAYNFAVGEFLNGISLLGVLIGYILISLVSTEKESTE